MLLFSEAQRAEERDRGIQIMDGFVSQIKEFDFHMEASKHHQKVLNKR